MSDPLHRQLLDLGLAEGEAQVYLTVVRSGGLSAAAIAKATKLARTGVYQVLASLADKGLVQTGLGYGSKFTAVSPDQALPLLVAREREDLFRRERLAQELGEQLATIGIADFSGADEPIQLIRNPQVFTDRFERLQLEAERQVDMFVKAPIMNPRKDNPGQSKAQRRGVQFRSLYEAATLEDPQIQPYLEGWIAGGEEARVYHGELPYKLAVFDEQVVLITLRMPGDQMEALLIRHQQLAKSLNMLFNFLWESPTAIPLAPTSEPEGRALGQPSRRSRKLDLPVRNGGQRKHA